MLRLQPKLSVLPESAAKCGEVFCHSLRNFTILCTFCHMKTFQFDDFLQHVRNVHLNYESELSLVDERERHNNYLDASVKNKIISIETDNALENSNGHSSIIVKNENNITLWDNNKLPLSSSDDTEISEGKTLKVLKKPKIKVNQYKYTRASGNNSDIEESKFPKDVADTLSNFIKKDIVPAYSCNECHETFLHKKYLDQHVRNLHNGYKCSLCDKRFSRTSHVKCHLKTHTAEKRFICSMENCGRGFIDEEYLKRHLEVHTMDRNYVCKYNNCGKAFQTQRRLASHEYYHRIPKKFVCDMCGYSCRSNPQLITHQRVHSGEKPFPCELCSKPFISKIALQEHMISHSKDRPHVCAVCNRGFGNRRVLVRHCFIHSEEKTFKCKLCESAFKHPNSLQGHMRYVHRHEAKQKPAKAKSIMNKINK